MSRADISVIVVNYNGAGYIEPCLSSVPETMPLIIVDNGSRDASLERFATAFPKARVVASGVNGGFARGVNLGVAEASTTYVCLLNPDARLEKGALEALASHLDQHPEAGMVAPQLLHEDGRPQHSFDNFPSLATAFLNKSLLRLLNPSRFPSKRQVFTEPREVESVIGACLMARRSLFRQIGGLDEEYFLFLEETDACLKAWRAGAKVVFFPGAKVVHLQGRAKDKVRIRARIEYTRSLFKFFRKNRPCQWLPLRILFPLKNLLEFVFQAPAAVTPKGRRRWIETAALLGWQLAGAPKGWGLSRAREPRSLRLSDGTWVLESHAEAFNQFNEKRRSQKLIEETDGKRRLEFTSAGRTYLIKVYKTRGWARFRTWLFGGRPSHERDMTLALLDRGIPIAPVVAIRERGGDPWLAVEKLEGARTVQEILLDANTPESRRRGLLRDYGRFVRRLFDAGVWQYDFNPTNVLVHEGRLLLIDFERMRLHAGRTPESERTYLFSKMQRIPALSRSSRLRFFLAYLEADAKARRTWKSQARAVLKRQVVQQEADSGRAEQRCLEDNRDYGLVKNGEIVAHYWKWRPERTGGLKEAEVAAFLSAPEQWVAEDHPEALKAWVEACRSGAQPLAVLLPKGGPAGRLIRKRR